MAWSSRCTSRETSLSNFSIERLPEYLWVLLRLRSIREAAKRYFIGSAGQQRVPADFLQGLVIPLPPPGIQRSIVDGVLEKRKAVKEERAGLDALRAAKVSEIERDCVFRRT